ncbi:2-oxoglutarate ferredoxin oxidoreductase subunit gamma [Peptoclostridium litorale DSM 5388]|uniref:Ketoisovalerate oxidoreductase subunit VorA n=1 Tax=Peptoclostridium litorale DSM 5388 TaxID=1121324 RepID=A0A069RHG3_PEPLI|nr:2-oxoacid:acceptor oxidoreductase family protein [Peptoclostridium litorale]KDR96479.1 ketoisovalerate oxidoreductase subunit VorA [Peptoclostridium litorale DSM 5388]SIN70114.1 2-oxoglutarate ferredoxin oxidoreductase subunit gamma [Peptoclostridium litorale DSM 5388]
MKEIVFAGFGGQGVLTSGLLISQIAVHKGANATWIPSYGSAMRGGTANCTVKYGDGDIYNPSQEEPDVLLAMNVPSFNKFINMVKPGGTVIVNSDLVTCDLNVRDDVNIVKVPCSGMANEINHAKGANIIMAGAIVKVTGDFTEKEAINGMNDMFRKKGKEKFEEINTKAFKAGYNFL